MGSLLTDQNVYELAQIKGIGVLNSVESIEKNLFKDYNPEDKYGRERN